MAQLGRPVPTHLRYELRLEVTPRDMRVADEYLFLFTSDSTRPAPGSFPQGRSVSGTTLKQPNWQSVIHREGRGAHPVHAGDNNSATTSRRCGCLPGNWRSARCHRTRHYSPPPCGSRRCYGAGWCSSTPTGRRCAARRRPATTDKAHHIRREPAVARPRPEEIGPGPVHIVGGSRPHRAASGQGKWSRESARKIITRTSLSGISAVTG